jgi:hypothetical protein
MGGRARQAGVAMIKWHRNRQTEQNRATRSLAGLALALFLVVIGFFLAQRLAQSARFQDCVLSGRSNCAMLDNASR